MIGPTGVGKTEIARRLARLAQRRSSRSKRRSTPRSATSAATSNHGPRPDRGAVGLVARSGSPRCARRRGRPRGAAARSAGAAAAAVADYDEQAAAHSRAGERTREKLREQLRAGGSREAGRDRRRRRPSVVRDHRRLAVEEWTWTSGHARALPGRTKSASCAWPRRSTRCAGRGAEADRQGEGRPRGDRARGAVRHHLPRRDRQGRGPRRRPRAGRLPRGRAARPAADRRRHDRQHQVRPGADRSHPVHRRRRVPRVQADRPDARAAGPLPDPRRARAPSAATTSSASSPSRRAR